MPPPTATLRPPAPKIAPPPAALEPAPSDIPEGPSLARYPGPHFGDDVAEATENQWQSEGYDRRRAPGRQQRVTDLFRGRAQSVLRDVQCRETLCRITFDAVEMPNAMDTLAKLGRTVAVLENNQDRVVILIPGTIVDSLPEA